MFSRGIRWEVSVSIVNVIEKISTGSMYWVWLYKPLLLG